MNYNKVSIESHRRFKGKLEICSKVPLITKDDLSVYYTPGVAKPCQEIFQNPELAYDYTWKNNTVAVVSDGSSVLGLGNIGGIAGLPVMEGKSILFKEFAGVNGIPIVLSTQDPDEVIKIVEGIAPTFGGINLEDIKAPECFYIEDKLRKSLNIPVFHDDQHGTAIVVLAGVINSLKLADKRIEDIKIVISGAGAAGTAISKLLKSYGAKNIVIADSKGAIYLGRKNLNKYKEEIAAYNINNEKGSIKNIIKGSDVFIGVSRPNLLDAYDIKNMNNKPIVFAMSNPKSEITPKEAHKGGVFIMATGRSDYPNQVNNLLAFPGLFKGVLDAKIKNIEEKHKLAAALALANYVEDLTTENILPSPLDKGVAKIVAEAVKNV